MNTSTLHAGIARRDITPPIGTLLFGYAHERPAIGVDDGLNATALVLQHNDVLAALVSLDLCVIDEAETQAIRELVTAATGIPPENVTLHATHTHSGPAPVRCWGWSEKNTEYLDSVRPCIVEAIAEAKAKLEPVRVGIGTVKTTTGINRREVDIEGNIFLGFNHYGPYDSEMTVARFEGEAGTIATFIHLGAHPTARGAEPSISRDWPGVMMDRVEKLTKAPVLFINGAFGDVAPRTNIGGPTGDGGAAANEVGMIAATDAMRVWKEIKYFTDLPLQTLTAEIELPHAPLAPLEEAEHQLTARADLQDKWGSEVCEKCHWTAVKEAHTAPLVPSRTYLQTITRIGPIAIVPFGGEIFAEIALRLRHHSPFAHTLVAGTTNACHGYLVTRDSRARGGYEVWVARAYNAYLLADNIDDVLVQENLKLLQQMDEKG